MIKASINATDLRRITDRLNKLKFVVSDLKNPNNPVSRFKFSIMVVYKNAIVRAMGSVQVIDYHREGEKNPSSDSFARGFHSNVVIDLHGLGTRQTSWKNLHPLTIDYKRKAKMRMRIWEASGESKSAVRIHSEDSFVGIDDSDPEALKHALAVEYGHGTTPDGKTRDWEKRALFTVANDVIMSQKNELLDRIRKIILTYISWGS